jgi:hypothetical protein
MLSMRGLKVALPLPEQEAGAGFLDLAQTAAWARTLITFYPWRPVCLFRSI